MTPVTIIVTAAFFAAFLIPILLLNRAFQHQTDRQLKMTEPENVHVRVVSHKVLRSGGKENHYLYLKANDGRSIRLDLHYQDYINRIKMPALMRSDIRSDDDITGMLTYFGVNLISFEPDAYYPAP